MLPKYKMTATGQIHIFCLRKIKKKKKLEII